MDLRTFTPLGSITIQQVLMRIRYNPSNTPFSIGFCRATSKSKAEPKGGIVWYDKALGGSPPLRRNGPCSEPVQAQLRDFRKEGVIGIYNVETNEYKTPLIASIMFFDGQAVKHPEDNGV